MIRTARARVGARTARAFSFLLPVYSGELNSTTFDWKNKRKDKKNTTRTVRARVTAPIAAVILVSWNGKRANTKKETWAKSSSWG